MRNISEDSISYIRYFDAANIIPGQRLELSKIASKKVGHSQNLKTGSPKVSGSVRLWSPLHPTFPQVDWSQKRCLQKFVHLCMIDGKKTIASKIVQATLYQLADHGDAISYLMKAIDNVKPILEVKRVRIAGSTQLVPSVISQNRQETLAIRWILEAAMIQKRRKGSTKVFSRKRQNKSQRLDQCLAAEIVDAYNKTGAVRKKRDELHKLAEANRGFSHYRWW